MDHQPGADGDAQAAPTTTAVSSATATSSAVTTPAVAPTLAVDPSLPTVDCAYPAERGASKPVALPANLTPPAEGLVQVDLDTSAGPIGLTLDRAEAPCTVESMVNLVLQDYYNDTPCHRLTNQGIFVLQCGDPTGKGSGGPGYTVQDEPPVNLAPYEVNGQDTGSSIYPRGTIAMAKTAAPNSGGSQFFLVYKDSPLPPVYTVFGQIDEAGLATLDAVAAKGLAGGAVADGAPADGVQIVTATIPDAQ